MNAADKAFEQKRNEIYRRKAEEVLKKLDDETCMMPGLKVSSDIKGGPHTEAGGRNVVETVDAAVWLAFAGHENKAWKALDAALEYQDRDPKSFTYGNYFWHSNWKVVKDPNAVAFILPSLTFLMKRMAKDFPKKLLCKAMDSLRLAALALDAHRATWGYTNMALMKIACRLRIADILDDTRNRGIAYWDWEEWSNHTGRLGMIPEFNSLSYTETQLHALAIMLDCDVVPEMHSEVRAVLRHLLTSTICDYHEGIGRITGPQSRAYENDRLYRNRSSMDTILHFTMGKPEPEGGCRAWYGTAIGPDDVIPQARKLALPRTSFSRCQGYGRVNYLDEDFALGSVSGLKPKGGCELPFFLAYRSKSDRCSIAFPFRSNDVPHAHFSIQDKNAVLAGNVFIYSTVPEEEAKTWKSRMSQLNTGKPCTIITNKSFRPGIEVELGHADEIVTLNRDRKKMDIVNNAALPGETVFIETESVYVGLKFLSSCPDQIGLKLEMIGKELILSAKGFKEAISVSELEKACMLGFYIQVENRRRISSVDKFMDQFNSIVTSVGIKKNGWLLKASRPGRKKLTLDARPLPSIFYQCGNIKVTGNSWGKSILAQNPESKCLFST